ncbi:MAG: hypothetical protein HXY43_03930 [Fischerella sp.]|uniref:hypothetical protein n=1 Tax=unclassified Fischerella TaxID=494603 RepID=UPI0012DDFAFF|nr:MULTISPECIES: hypothetical protein [unclassified Fischerella]NWF58466.1 hypothetical protein [Fischerella sp.]
MRSDISLTPQLLTADISSTDVYLYPTGMPYGAREAVTLQEAPYGRLSVYAYEIVWGFWRVKLIISYHLKPGWHQGDK